MRPRNRVSSAGIELVKRFEGYRGQAAQLPDGRWTIGYGHTLTAREGAQVSEADAESLLIYDLHTAAKAVDEMVFAPLNQNQFDALCSFAFNVGLDEFRGSDVLKRLNEGGVVQAACAMELWRKAEFEGEVIVVDALVRRRAAEKILFLTPPDDAFVPAPSPVLRPRRDPRAASLVPAEAPTELATTLYGASVIVTRPKQTQPAEPPPSPPAPTAPSLDIVEPEAPPPPSVDRVTAAAEAVTSRLETLFAESPERDDEHEGFVEAPIEDPVEDQPDEAPEPEPAFQHEPLPEPPRERDEDEEAFIEAFIEAGEDPPAGEPAPEPELEFQPEPREPTPPEPAMTPQTITPIVMSYPATPIVGATPAFQPTFTGRPGLVSNEILERAPEAGPYDVDAEPSVIDARQGGDEDAAIQEPIQASPPIVDEPDADLWGDDGGYEPPPGAPAIASEEGDELELAPAAEVSPSRLDDEYGLDAFQRRPDPEPSPTRDTRSPYAVEATPVQEFLPKRPQREERSREPGLLTDLFLALLGIAFFGFAVFWALNADPAGPGVHPSLVAWPTGFIGIGFVVVAIFRLLERLGDAAERD